jgi:hypothetical protein
MSRTLYGLAVIGDPIDPTPFLEAMPEPVRAVIERARQKAGPAATWLVAKGRGWGQVGTTMTILRDAQMSPELAGWLAGIAMFGDDTDRLVDELEGHAAVPFALAAFAAGVCNGVATAAGQWTRIERLTAIGRPPAALSRVIPLGCASDDRAVRLAAKRLAQKLGYDADDALESAHASAAGTTRRRLNAARGPVDPREGLLLRLLDAWRATRAAALEPKIASLGTALGRTREAIAGKTREALEATWAAIAKDRDPIDVARLLDADWPKSLDAARRRVELFAKFPADPRIVLGIATRAKRHRSSQSLRFHGAVADLILEAPTKSVVTTIAEIIGAHDDGEIMEVYEAAREQAAKVRTLVPDPALLEEAHAADEPQRNLTALWTQHVADPGNLHHRAVLGDALQAAGDPRGELIALQLVDGDATTRKRIAELLAAYADRWTGPIPNVSKSSRRFERGFLTSMRCTAIGPELRAVIERPEWVTLEDLYLDGAGAVLAPLIRRMPLLRNFATPHADLLTQLARSGKYPSFVALATRSAWLPPRDAFPNVRVIGGRWITTAWTDAFVAAQRDAAALGIQAIVHVGFPEEQLVYALPNAVLCPIETRFVIGGDFAGFDTDGWRLRLPRGQRTAELAWGGGPARLKGVKLDIVDQLRAAKFDVREVKHIDLAA